MSEAPAFVFPDRLFTLTFLLTLAALLLIIKLGLLPTLLAGFLVYQLIELGARHLGRFGILPLAARAMLVFVVFVFVLSVFGLIASAFLSFLSDGPESFSALLERMADVVDSARSYLPEWVQAYLPSNIEEWQVVSSEWLRDNASRLSLIGREAGLLLIHILIGMVIGGMVAFKPAKRRNLGPLAAALQARVLFLDRAFRRIVFSQFRISALNTVLTMVFLAVILPIFGHHLPLMKTMVVVTFVAGLLPVVGNLMSNTAIFLISLSVSPLTAVLSLSYLIIIHKLEYFLNARIIGGQIRSRAWEILIAMVAMETAFGIPGLIAAPIYYAYLKDELSVRQLI